MLGLLLAGVLTTGTAALPTTIIATPKVDIRVEIASTQTQQERGLMGRTALAPHTGMLFVFPSDQYVAFWMKDTLIPLDMVFIGADGRVRSVEANVPAFTPDMSIVAIPRRYGQAKFVIELPAGEATRDDIAPGTLLGGLPQNVTQSGHHSKTARLDIKGIPVKRCL